METMDCVNNTYSEPDMKMASTWYPRMKNQFTHLGWKNALFEFLILWNGDVAAPTQVPLKKALDDYHHADAQFSFYWKVGDLLECGGDKLHDNSPVKQEYQDGWKPVILTKSFVQGLEITETAFVHVPQAKEAVNADENMFLWLDFNISKAIDILVPEDEITLYVQVNAHSLRNSMETGHNSYSVDSPQPYAHELHVAGNYLIQDDEKVRMALVGEESRDISYQPVWNEKPWIVENRNGVLKLKSILHDGKSSIRLIIPMLPAAKDALSPETALGYDAALCQTLDFWEKECAAGIDIEASDKIIQNTFKSNPWRMLAIAEFNPVFKEYSLNNGAFSYDALWPTPACMSTVWGLDYAGCHKDAERYLEVYRKDQGNAAPPGSYYLSHPGFLSTPGSFEAIRWVNEHGAIMWAVAEHYLLTGDRLFLEKWLHSLLKACEWIHVQRNNTDHPGVKGVLPPGTATDDAVYGQFIWSDGWMYKGLTSVIKVLAAINHPEAERWEQEAKEYKKSFNTAYLETCNNAPLWVDGEGAGHRFIPTEISGKLWSRNRHAFYLDTGPLFLAFSGLVDIDNGIYDDVLKWLREGPHVKYWRFDGCCWQVPVLHHEMSSCEPCYSWNMDVNFLRNDREHFIEGLFAQFAGARNTDLFSDVETRNGMFATNFTTPVTFYHFRNALVYENGNRLEFFRMLPLAFLAPGSVLKLSKLPTYFGKVNLSIECDTEGKSIRINISSAFRSIPESVRVFIPPQISGRNIYINNSRCCLTSDYVELEDKL